MQYSISLDQFSARKSAISQHLLLRTVISQDYPPHRFTRLNLLHGRVSAKAMVMCCFHAWLEGNCSLTLSIAGTRQKPLVKSHNLSTAYGSIIYTITLDLARAMISGHMTFASPMGKRAPPTCTSYPRGLRRAPHTPFSRSTSGIHQG